MIEIFAAGASPENKFFVSNHSYARPVGWTGQTFPAPPVVPPVSTQTPPPGKYWSTDATISEEDHMFGRYTADESGAVDALVYSSETFLPVWAAGNERAYVNIPDYPQTFWHWEYDESYPDERK